MKFNKKPDIETESLRVWKNKASDKDKKKIRDVGIELKMKDKDGKEVTTQLCGFTTARDKKTNELSFAYKFKHKDKLVLYYNKAKDESSGNAIRVLIEACKVFGYSIQDVEQQFADLINDKGLMKMIDEVKSDEK